MSWFGLLKQDKPNWSGFFKNDLAKIVREMEEKEREIRAFHMPTAFREFADKYSIPEKASMTILRSHIYKDKTPITSVSEYNALIRNEIEQQQRAKLARKNQERKNAPRRKKGQRRR